MASPTTKIVEQIITQLACYTITPTSFIKSDLRPEQRTRDWKGDLMFKPWAEQRLRNEAAALKLLFENTTIPVPKVIQCGIDDEGVPFLKLERIDGISCIDAGNETCHMPGQPNHVKAGPCQTCQDTAKENGRRFIVEVVLPQLQTLKSDTTGLNGFVVPPVWVLEHDKRPKWESRKSPRAEFVFCLGDLNLHNIMCDPKTLNITYLYDLEHAGFFPPECQLWTLGWDEFYRLFEDTARLDSIVSLIDGRKIRNSE